MELNSRISEEYSFGFFHLSPLSDPENTRKYQDFHPRHTFHLTSCIPSLLAGGSWCDSRAPRRDVVWSGWLARIECGVAGWWVRAPAAPFQQVNSRCWRHSFSSSSVWTPAPRQLG